MKLKRWISAVMTVAMLLTLVPVTGTAAEPGTAARSGISGGTETVDGMVLTKTAQLQADGTYTINLEAYATGQTTTSVTTHGIPMDIVLVLDQSGSMMDPINTTAVDKNDASVQQLGAAPGAYVVQGEDSGFGYPYYHAVQYQDGAWYYDSDTKDGALTLTVLDDDAPIYLSRLGALSVSIQSFVDSILEDTTAYDEYVDHRIAIVGYGFGPASNDSSYGIVSPGSANTVQKEQGFVNTGLYVDGTLVNYDYYASGIADYSPETYMPHYFISNNNGYLIYYCDNCQGWYTKNHLSTAYCNSTSSSTKGVKYTPKTSESGSGTLFYDIKGHSAQNYKDALVSVNDGSNTLNASISTAISNIGAYGATFVGYGMDMAKNIFAENPVEADAAHKRIVVVFSDGACEETNIQMAVNNADELNSVYNATVYSVGLYGSGEETAEIKQFMHAISSNYPSATYNGSSYTLGQGNWQPVYELEAGGTYYIKSGSTGTYADYIQISYGSGKWTDANGNVVTPRASKDDTSGTQVYLSHYMSASNASGLNTIFTSIATTASSTSTNVTMSDVSILKDVLNPGLFKLSDGYSVTIKTQTVTTSNGVSYAFGAVKNFASADGITFTNGSESLTLTVDTENNSISVTGFDYAEKYVSPGHPGEKICVTITGVTALDAAATGGYVFTNEPTTSGIYDGGYIVAPFPKPQALIPCKSFVLDYAKPITMDAAQLGLDNILDLSTTMDAIDGNFGGMELTYGTLTVESDGTMGYAPKTMDWKGYDCFYVFGTRDEAGTTVYEWVKVCIMPANNIYFEDDFVTSTDSGMVGIVYSGDWTVEGTPADDGETPNGDIHGWEDFLADDNGYSDGSAHISSAAGATATFTFTGTGVDIYSRTNLSSGMIVAILTKDSEEVANMVLMVDNLSASGDYYQIPTLSIHTIYDEQTQQEIEMPYGTYTLQLMVTTAYTPDEEGGEATARSTYYLDGIRVYNPLQSSESSSVVNGAYGEEELNASFTEIRDLLIDASSFADPSATRKPATRKSVATKSTGGSWTKVTLDEISAGDQIAITMTYNDTTWALTNTNGTGSAPAAEEVTVNGNIMTSNSLDGISWNISKDGDNLTIYVAGGTDKWLYSTSTNNGVRVGTNANSVWTLDSTTGYLKHTGTGRYLGVYRGTPDWRAYTNTTGNTANQILNFWKYTSDTTDPGEGGGTTEPADMTATLVTDVNSLKAGDQIIIVANGYSFALSTTQNTNNRGQIGITKNGSTVTYNENTQVIVLQAGTVDGTFAFSVEGGYLYAASNSSNHLKTQAAIDANACWLITIDSSGVATITAQGANSHNILRYNSSSSLFSAYGAGNTQQDIAIYKINAGHTHSYTEQITVEATCTEEGEKTFSCSCGDSYTEVIAATGHSYADGYCEHCGEAEPTIKTATLVTNANSLTAGEQIIIVSKDFDFALSTNQKTNNRGQAAVTRSEDGTIVYFDKETQVITLTEGYSAGTFGFSVGELGYLYASSGASNQLKSTTTLSANASWSIAIDASGGIATIVATGDNTHNVIRHNAVDSLFACYLASNSQKDVQIYRIEDLEEGGSEGGDDNEGEIIGVTGMVFIDQLEDKTTGQLTNDVGVYTDYGPKNEVYLAPGQSIVFRVDGNAANHYYIGLKAPQPDQPVTVKYSGSGDEQTISHSTDLYYKLTPDSDGYVVVMNVSGGLLALTKLRTTGYGSRNLELRAMTRQSVIDRVNSFATAQEPGDPDWLDSLVVDLFKSLRGWFSA